MAIIASYAHKLGTVEAYYHLKDYTVDRTFGGVNMTLAVYRDASARAAYKSATAEIGRLRADLAKARGAAVANRDRVAQVEAALEAQLLARASVLPGDELRLSSAPGEIPLSADGEASVKAIYVWLMRRLKAARES